MVVAKLYESFNVRYDEDAFCFFDRNSDESINVDEFHEAMGRLQFTGEGTIGLMRGEVAELIDRIDSDSSGEISFAEFRAALDVNSMSEAYEAIKQVRMGTHALPHARSPFLPHSIPRSPARPPSQGAGIQEGDWAFSQKEIPPVFADLGTAFAAPACTIPAAGAGARSPAAAAAAGDAAGVEVVSCRPLPSNWPRDWELSDHLPVRACFRWRL